MGRRIGYARVSTDEQSTEAQREALERAGCVEVYEDIGSGGNTERPALEALLDELAPGDTLVVWKLDRLSRSLLDLLGMLGRFRENEVGFVSLTEAIDTTTAAGRMLLSMIGAFAEFEREMIRERTKAGLEQAKKRGVLLGRPKALTLEQREEIKRRVASGEWTQADAARLFKVHRSTIGKMLKRS